MSMDVFDSGGECKILDLSLSLLLVTDAPRRPSQRDDSQDDLILSNLRHPLFVHIFRIILLL